MCSCICGIIAFFWHAVVLLVIGLPALVLQIIFGTVFGLLYVLLYPVACLCPCLCLLHILALLKSIIFCPINSLWGLVHCLGAREKATGLDEEEDILYIRA
eukprot:TRINITY_DN51499_c0_g1_i1.p2 TRINITY_DN51499_c0_g1~~TRINITY_DN51499_c0_g1_i1.p2  ORF type:complete len:101 (+),score=17.89 TRINITY_DN51499_c0_g1_i1:74-376(+)